MSKINNDIRLLEDFLIYNDIKDTSLIDEENKLSNFQIAGKVYPFTNEYLKDYYEKDLIGKKVLSVTSSADHILHAIYAGANSVTAFDINRFCKYFSALKIAMLKKYDYNDFIKNINNFIAINPHINYEKNIDDFKKTLNDVSKNLTNNELDFFRKFIVIFDSKKASTSLFRYFYEIKNNLYYEEEKYNILKEKLSDVNIKYVDSGIDKLSDKNIKNIDFMYISNILSYVNEIDIPDVLINLSDILSKGGKISMPGSMNLAPDFFASDNDISKKYYVEDNLFYEKEEKGSIILIKK